MRQGAIVLCLLFVVTVAAQQNKQETARQLNQRVKAFASRLNHIQTSATYYSMLGRTVRMALRCDSLDEAETKEGQMPRFRSANRRLLSAQRRKLVDGGLFFHRRQEPKRALEQWALFVRSADSPLFADTIADPLVGRAAYYAALLCYKQGQYAEAGHFADKALMYDEYTADAAEIKVGVMKENLQTAEDSTRYLVTLIELRNAAPGNSLYTKLLMDYFSSAGHYNELQQFALDEIRRDSTSAQPWTFYGETLMARKQWRKAMQAFERANKLDSTVVTTVYNLGVCAAALAQLQDSDTVNTDTVEAQKLKMLAEQCFLRVSKMDEERSRVDWVKPLYQLYFQWKKKEEAERLLPLLSKE